MIDPHIINPGGLTMKPTILAFAAFVLSTQAHAMFISPDQIYTTIKCEGKVTVPDLSLGVEVRQGGIAGLTQVVVSKFFLGHSSINQYYVRVLPAASKAL